MAIIFMIMTLIKLTKWIIETNLILKLKTMNQRQIVLLQDSSYLKIKS